MSFRQLLYSLRQPECWLESSTLLYNFRIRNRCSKRRAATRIPFYNRPQVALCMKIIVIGGHSRNIGKTSVMAELIRCLRPPEWGAVKITQYGHGVYSPNGESCSCDPSEHGFTLTEERQRTGRGDTRRLLRAGARRSLWLRVGQDQLPRAFPSLLRALRPEKWVMIESNSVLGLVDPDLYLFVLNRSRRDFKASARKYLERADALVTIGSSVCSHPWSEVDAALFRNKPIFPVEPPNYGSEDLNCFVRQKLGLPEGDRPADR